MTDNIIAKYEKVPFDEFVSCLNKTNAMRFLTEEPDVAYNNIELPRCSSVGSAGHDFRCPFDLDMEPGVRYTIPTGIRCKMDDNWVLMLYPRSGLGSNYGFRLVNTVGVIDSSYYNADNYGHIMAVVEVERPLVISKGTKFMQGVFTPIGFAEDAFSTEIRTGGFGSTGLK